MLDEAGPRVDVSSIVEVPSQFPKEAQFRDILVLHADKIRKKIKWQKGITDKNGANEPLGEKRAMLQIDGLLRGDFAERLSEILPIGECETVFSTDDIPEDLEVETFKAIHSKSSKGKLLDYALQKSFAEEPPEGIKTYLGKTVRDETKRKDAFDRMMREIRLGYAADNLVPGWEGLPGMLYADSVIPDGVLLNAQGEIAGFSEVKAYSPEEFDAFVVELNKLKAEGSLTKPSAQVSFEKDGIPVTFMLGPEIFDEINFIDHIRRVGYGQQELNSAMQILLRFPWDISDASLKEYGRLLQELHLQHVLIQKLPMSSEELSQTARAFIRDNIEKIKTEDNGSRFSDKEIQVLEAYAVPVKD